MKMKEVILMMLCVVLMGEGVLGKSGKHFKKMNPSD
jgi:hypothetical protein